MGTIIRQAIEKRKSHLISKLLSNGIYKKNDLHLFELTLTELEEEFKRTLKMQCNEIKQSYMSRLNLISNEDRFGFGEGVI
ncbi:Fur-regulated basic protein FbpA [Metabacillus idriensis]|uniref:Fur-regulated basic protein FbpA n=2 Tax=Bacillaceae TaxID=186817 RepID=UPI00174A3D54|nr:Fur-regulated basic protein FbpA [Metabacillus idriensis]